MYFIAKDNLSRLITLYGIILGIWCPVAFSAYQVIAKGKTSELLILMVICISVITALMIWLFSSCGYTITDDYLIYKTGPMRGRMKLSDIEIIRWDYSVKSRAGLYIRSKSDILKILPEDVSAFLKLLRKRCPTAEITTIEIPPSFFGEDFFFDTISDREKALDAIDTEKHSNKVLLLIIATFPLLFWGFICVMGYVVIHYLK